MKELIKKVKGKKELKNIEDRYVSSILDKILKQSRKYAKAVQEKRTRSKAYKEIVKKAREKLRLEYGMFSEHLKEREKLLQALQKGVNTTEKLLQTHRSTKERIETYPHIYQKIFGITGKPKTILDLGCGMNPVSYPYMKLDKITYYASELNKKDCMFLEKYFKAMKIKGKTFAIDLKKPELLKNIPESDICLLLKVLDTIEKKGHKLAEEILTTVKAKWVIVSFATNKLGGRPMKHPYRGWLERMINRLGYHYTTIEEKNEIFYLIKK